MSCKRKETLNHFGGDSMFTNLVIFHLHQTVQNKQQITAIFFICVVIFLQCLDFINGYSTIGSAIREFQNQDEIKNTDIFYSDHSAAASAANICLSRQLDQCCVSDIT